MAEYTYMSTGDTLFVAGEGKSWLLGSSDAERRAKIIELIKEDKPWPLIKEALEESEDDESLREWCDNVDVSGSGISFNDTTIIIDNIPVYGALCRQIRLMHDEGLPLEPMINFVRKMRNNPSYRIREQLWGFIEACQKDGGFTIARDGDIMAYKVVSEDFKDKHSGRFDNSIGSIVSMPREEVDDDPSHTCSSGLHFCAYSYVNSFINDGDHLVLVKINPADVVSIPADYDNAKARCCRYQVIEEVKTSLNTPVWDKHECNVESKSHFERNFKLGDKIRANISSYDFPDNNSDGVVICRIVAIDTADEHQPYKVRFFDGLTIAEWWIYSDDALKLVRSGDEKCPSFDLNDECYIYDTYKGRIVDYDKEDNTYVVNFEDVDGDDRYATFEAYDLSHVNECTEESEFDLDDDSEQEICCELKKKLGELEDLLKRELRKLDNSESSDQMSDEEFVRKWMEESPKKMVIALLESQYDDIMDSKMRIKFIDEVPVNEVVRRLIDWYREEYDDNISRNRIWEKIRTTIEIWQIGRK